MLDRESTFAHPKIVSLLRNDFVPVAIDQAYQRRQKDAEGDFYRKLAGQGPRGNFQGTTQGFYVGTADGKLLLYNNNRDPEKVFRLMKESLAKFKQSRSATSKVAAIERGDADARYNPDPPEGGLVVRVRAKVLDGYEPTDDRWRRIFQSAVSRDNLWISKKEHQALVDGQVLPSLQQRIARFHLVDNTRGEPPMWSAAEARFIELSLEDGVLSGSANLRTARGDRSYDAQLRGHVEVRDNRVVKFQLVAKGEFRGEGPYTRGAPKGKFPLAVTFELADFEDPADRVPPQGSRGWVRGYIQ